MNAPTPSSNGKYWTSPRILLAVLIVAMGLAPAGYVAYTTLARPSIPHGGVSPPRGAAGTGGLDAQFDLTNLTLPEDEIRSGGPRKDGIPALTTAAATPSGERTAGLHGMRPPEIAPVAEADALADTDRIVGVTMRGESRAYPIAVLNYHECVNDVLGDIPIAIIYCPLCDSVSVVDRRRGGQSYEFGISGLLHNSNVLLYDRTDHALWSQVALEAVSGPNAGQSLKHLGDWTITTFGQWKKAHPESTALTRDTGHHRRYARNPYAGYFQTDRLMFPVQPRDERMPPKTRVVGLATDRETLAVPMEAIGHTATGVTIGEHTVTLRTGDAGAVEIGELPDAVRAVHTFWFAWAAFHPRTAIYSPGVED